MLLRDRALPAPHVHAIRARRAYCLLAFATRSEHCCTLVGHFGFLLGKAADTAPRPTGQRRGATFGALQRHLLLRAAFVAAMCLGERRRVLGCLLPKKPEVVGRSAAPLRPLLSGHAPHDVPGAVSRPARGRPRISPPHANMCPPAMRHYWSTACCPPPCMPQGPCTRPPLRRHPCH